MDFYDDLANYLVWPTEVDHHGSGYGAGAGLTFVESIMGPAAYFSTTGVNRVISGFALPASGSATNATITAGTAIIAGHYITGTTGLDTIDFTDTTSYVYLALSRVGDEVTQPIIKVETARLTGASMGRYFLLLGTVTAAGGTISGQVDMRVEGRHLWGSVTHSDAGTPTVVNPGSANWVPTQSGGRTVITFDNAFLFRAPTVVVSSDNGLASNYASSTTTATIDGTNAVVFSFHIMG